MDNKTMITSGREVRDHVEQGWELWHVSKDPLPGRWELRQGAETKLVSWDAIERLRTHYLDWFRAHTEAIQQSRFTWIYRLKQRQFHLAGSAAS